MTKVLTTFRWFLLSLLVLFLLALAGYILLYSLGMKIDWQNWKIDKTGMLFVKTKPSDVVVKLDGKRVAEKTPVKIRWLFPGQYRIEVSKPGCHSWSKSITIEPGMVAEEKSIRLFLKKPAAKIIGQPDNAVILNNREAGYLINDSKITFFSLSPDRRKTIAQLDEKIEKMTFNNNQSQILINQKLVVNLLSGKTVINLAKSFPKFRNFRFNPGNHDQLISRYNNRLYLIDVKTKKKKRIWTIDPKISYQIDSQGIWSLNKKKSLAMLLLKEWSGRQRLIAEKEIEVEEDNKKSKLYLTELSMIKKGSQILFYDQEYRYYRLEDSELIYLGDQISDIEFDYQNNQKYLFSNQSNEIWLVAPPDRPDQEKRKLITRLTNYPDQLNLLGYYYLTFISEQKLYLIDYDGLNNLALMPNTNIKRYWIVDDQTLIVLTAENKLIRLKISDY